MKQYLIDGGRFSDVSGFYDEVEQVLLANVEDFGFGRNLDALNDILRGGFGTPSNGFVLVWKSSDISKMVLGEDTFDTIVEIISGYRKGNSFPDYEIILKLE